MGWSPNLVVKGEGIRDDILVGCSATLPPNKNSRNTRWKHLTWQKKCNKWADQAKIHVSNHVSAFPRLRSTITIPCMWLTLWSDSFSPIWQSHHFLMVSNVSVSSTLVHHITMMCVTIMSLCKVLPTHHYNITRAQQFSTYMSRFWSKITKWSTDLKTKRWLHLNLAIIYQFLH